MGRIEYEAMPIRAFPEHTVRIPGGAVTFGVEYRRLDEATILAEMGPDARARFGGVVPAGMGAVIEEDGVALHVFDAATGDELLRFDCFDDAAHWHLLAPGGGRNVVIEHDPAEGPLLPWAVSALRCRLRDLLAEAGAPAVAAALGDDEVRAGLDVVAQVARYVEAAGRPVSVG